MNKFCHSHRYSTITLDATLLCCAVKKTGAKIGRVAIAVSGQMSERRLDLYSE